MESLLMEAHGALRLPPSCLVLQHRWYLIPFAPQWYVWTPAMQFCEGIKDGPQHVLEPAQAEMRWMSLRRKWCSCCIQNDNHGKVEDFYSSSGSSLLPPLVRLNPKERICLREDSATWITITDWLAYSSSISFDLFRLGFISSAAQTEAVKRCYTGALIGVWKLVYPCSHGWMAVQSHISARMLALKFLRTHSHKSEVAQR